MAATRAGVHRGATPAAVEGMEAATRLAEAGRILTVYLIHPPQDRQRQPDQTRTAEERVAKASIADEAEAAAFRDGWGVISVAEVIADSARVAPEIGMRRAGAIECVSHLLYLSALLGHHGQSMYHSYPQEGKANSDYVACRIRGIMVRGPGNFYFGCHYCSDLASPHILGVVCFVGDSIDGRKRRAVAVRTTATCSTECDEGSARQERVVNLCYLVVPSCQ